MLRSPLVHLVFFSFLESCASQATDCDCSAPADTLRYQGLHLNVLANGLERTDFQQLVNAWKTQTGTTINIEFSPPHDMFEATMSDKNRGGANYYDVYILDNRHLPEFAELGYAMDITEAVSEAGKACESCTATRWADIASFVRGALSKYDQKIYGVPLDGDTFQLYFRRDVFTNPAAFLPVGTIIPLDLRRPQPGGRPSQLQVPSTWPEYARIAELFRGVDLNNDGSPDLGNCMPIKGAEAFYWLTAPLVALFQHRTEAHGAFFKLTDSGIEPLVKNAAFAHVVEMLKRLYVESGGADDSTTLSWDASKSEEAFRDGRCLMYLSWPSTALQSTKKTGNGTYVYLHGRMGVAPLPGWDMYFNRDAESLQNCTAESCPSSGANGYPDGVNAAAFMARGGMTGVVNNDRPYTSKEAALDLLVYLSNNLGVTNSSLYNAYRTSQLDIRSFLTSGWDALDAADFIDATERTLKHPLQVLDMRIVEDGFGIFSLYQQAFEDALMGKHDIATVQSRLSDEMEALIKKVDEDTGRNRFFENTYRKSIGLPARIDIMPTDDYTGMENLPWALAVTVMVMMGTPIVFYRFRDKVMKEVVVLLNWDLNEIAFDVLIMVTSIVQYAANVLTYREIRDRATLKKYKDPFIILLMLGGASVLMYVGLAVYSVTHVNKSRAIRTSRNLSREEYVEVLRALLLSTYRKARLGIATSIGSLMQDIPILVIVTLIWFQDPSSLGIVLQSCFCATIGSIGMKTALGKEAYATLRLHSTLSVLPAKLEGRAVSVSVFRRFLTRSMSQTKLVAGSKCSCCWFCSRTDPDISIQLDCAASERMEGLHGTSKFDVVEQASDGSVCDSPDSSQISETHGWIRPDLANPSKHQDSVQQISFTEKSLFQDMPVACSDGTQTLTGWYVEDKNPMKVNLSLGAYCDDDGKPWTSPLVVAARLAHFANGEDEKYVPIDGNLEQKKTAQRLVFSEDEIGSGKLATTLATAGIKSLSIVSQFLANFMNCRVIHVSNTAWGNLNVILRKAGLEVRMYPYYRSTTRRLDFDGMLEAIMKMPPGEAILLQTCGHDPSGVDPSDEEWQRIVDVCKVRGLVPVLDNAYQGLASGNLETDCLSMRLFEWAGVEYFILQSFVNNLGFYSDHVGYIHIRCKSTQVAGPVLSQLKALMRQADSSPPRVGAAVVHTLLSNPEWKAQWLEELQVISQRILKMRNALRKALEAEDTPGTWNHITDQVGMFSYTGLTLLQVERMINQFHVYMTRDGRISIPGLNEGNLAHVAKSIAAVVRAGS